MVFNFKFIKIWSIYTLGAERTFWKDELCAAFGNIVLDLSVEFLVHQFAGRLKDSSSNLLRKGVWFFFFFLAKKSFVNHKPTRLTSNYAFKVKLSGLKSFYFFSSYLFVEHEDTFNATKQIISTKSTYLKIANFLGGYQNFSNSDLFQNLYKDIQLKTFNITAKFLKTSFFF